MKPKILIRIAAVLMFIHTVGHSFGALAGGKAPNAAVAQVMQGMQQNHFSFMGRSASLAIFFNGYGVAIILFLLFSSFVLWWLATEAGTPFGRKLAVLSALYLTALTVIEVIYCFPFYFTAAAAICMLAALPRRVAEGS